VTLTEDTVVVDLVGKFKGLVLPEKYIGDVGKLTTSILLYRVATHK
jgi:predicted Zn-dependent protease with MMP-like domain